MQMAQQRQHSDILRAVPTTAANCINCLNFKVREGVAGCKNGLIRTTDRYGYREKTYRLGYYFDRYQVLRLSKDWAEAERCPLFDNLCD
jgi:hypothetical protein